MIRRIGVDQAAVVLVDHLGGAVAHLVGQPFNRDNATGQQLAGVGMAAIVGSTVGNTTGIKVGAPAVFDLIIVVVGAGAFAVPQPLLFDLLAGAVVAVEQFDGLGRVVFDQFNLLG